MPGQNPGFIFLFFAIYGLLSLYVTSKFMLETKDKSEQQICEEYLKMDH
jgi:hypothetical protein